MSRALLVIAAIALLAAKTALAQSVLEMTAGIKFCKTLTDDAQRLKCFDSLFAAKSPVQPTPESPQVAASWSIEESKSPIDDSPQVTGTLMFGMAALILRCKERKTEVFFYKSLSFLGTDAIKVLMRINDGKPIETTWSASTNGQAAFAPAPVQFIRALPNNGKLFIRATAYDGGNVDGEFNLGNVSEIRDKIAKACRWPLTPSSALNGQPRAAGRVDKTHR